MTQKAAIEAIQDTLTAVEGRVDALEMVKAHGRLKRLEKRSSQARRFILSAYVVLATVPALVAVLYFLDWWTEPGAPAALEAVLCDVCAWEDDSERWLCVGCQCAEPE